MPRGKTLLDSQSENSGLINLSQMAIKEGVKTTQGFLNLPNLTGGAGLKPPPSAADDKSTSSYGRKNTSRINKDNVTDISAVKEKSETEQKDLFKQLPHSKDPNTIYVDHETEK